MMTAALWRAARPTRQVWASTTRRRMSAAAGPSVVKRTYAVQSEAQSIQQDHSIPPLSSTMADEAASSFSANQPGDTLSKEASLNMPSDEISRPGQLHLKLRYLPKPDFTPKEDDDSRKAKVKPPKVYVPVSEHVFGIQPRRDILHAAVVYYLDGIRNGTASTKTRGEVAFSGAKIRPQKGSGQARLGTRSNPLLRKGGVIHGPRPRDMSSKLNRRVRELALRSALSAKYQAGQLFVVKELDWIPPPCSTTYLNKILKSNWWDDALFLTAPRHPQPSISTTLKPKPKPSASDPIYTEKQQQEHAKAIRYFELAMRNIARTEMIRLDELALDAVNSKGKPLHPDKPSELHAYSILKRKMLVCDVGAIEWLEEKLGGAIFHHNEDVDLLAKNLEELNAQESIEIEEASQVESREESSRPGT